MKLAVIGSRSFDDKMILEKVLNEVKTSIGLIITGGAKGADQLAEQWANNNNIPVQIIKPDWSKYGRSAGIVRNKQIIELCDSCLAFWDSQSKGTLSGINHCKKILKPIRVIQF